MTDRCKMLAVEKIRKPARQDNEFKSRVEKQLRKFPADSCYEMHLNIFETNYFKFTIIHNFNYMYLYFS